MNPDAKSLLHLCFDGMDGYIELSIGGVHKKHRKAYKTSDIDLIEFDDTIPNIFFGPATRNSDETCQGKKTIAASQLCWIDYDDTSRPVPILPPTVVINSGHGWHHYYKLTHPLTKIVGIEKLNQALQDEVEADSCFNADRIMRLPGTINHGEDKAPVECTLDRIVPGNIYDPKQLYLASMIRADVRKRIITGDMKGFKTRSERDWAIIRYLVHYGLDEDTIVRIFREHACGDKFRDPEVDGVKYLEHTIERARESPPDQTAGAGRKKRQVVQNVLIEEEDGYYIQGRGKKRISTFVLEPTLLLEGSEGDAIMCNVRCAGTDFVWENELFPIRTMSNNMNFIKRLDKAAWVWLGRDSDVHMLQMHLISKLQEMGVPRALMTSVVGVHQITGDKRKFYVADEITLGSDGSVWGVGNAPIVYMDIGRDHPPIHFGSMEPDTDLLREIAMTLPTINTSDVIWPLIGWFMATPLKVLLEEYGYRFPVLNVFGTRGSGKTTTILRVFHPLLGYTEERTYDANTTRFVMLSLLGSTNAAPVSFSEFRVATVADFARYILLAYDTGRDPRGRPDQTTVDYPLSAPFTIDGEDLVEDPASMERIVAVRMIPRFIEAGTKHSAAFDYLQTLDLSNFAGPYIQYAINADVPMLIDTAEQAMWDVFPESLPNRVRKNLTVVWMGILLLGAFMRKFDIWCMPRDGVKVLRTSLNNVYSVKLGRAPTEADSFVEVIINAAARGSKAFPWELDKGVLWFQLMPSFEFYVNQRVHQRRSTLSREAIRTQLLELTSEYTITPEIRVLRHKKVMAYGVELSRAHKAGLDVPSNFVTTIVEIEID